MEKNAQDTADMSCGQRLGDEPENEGIGGEVDALARVATSEFAFTPAGKRRNATKLKVHGHRGD
jgi:hypothetical protein